MPGMRRQIGKKAARDREAVGFARVPAARWGVIAGPRDCDCSFDRHARRCHTTGVIDKTAQQAATRTCGEPESVADGQVSLKVLVEVDVSAHRTPPIQGNATLASVSRSSLA